MNEKRTMKGVQRSVNQQNRHKYLKFWYTNAKSLNNKLTEFHAIITEVDPDIIGITETWVNVNNYDSEYNVNNNYIVFRKDRKTITTGGGVMLLVKKNLNVTEAKFPDEDDSSSETLWCNLKTISNKILRVGICYTPKRDEKVDLKIAREIKWASKSEVIIMGDFNYAGIDWASFTGCNKYDDIFIDTLRENFLYQHVKEPTRGDRILDLVLSLSENDISSIEINPGLGKSDHKTLSWNYLLSTDRKENTLKVPDFRKADFNKLRELMKNVNWECMANLNAEEAWVKFKNIIQEGVEMYVPFKQFREINKPMWMTTEILRGIKAKKKLWRKHRTEKDKFEKSKYWAKYKTLEKEVHTKIRIQKASFEDNIAVDIKNNPKKFYSYVRSKNKTKEGIGPLLSDSGQLVETDNEMVQILNNFFSSVFTIEDMSKVPNEIMPVASETLDNINCTLDDVAKGLQKLNVNKACGPDKLYPRILKELSDVITKPLHIIFNKTLKEGRVPNDWKLANVTPIFKKGSRNIRSNYRPVSLTSVVCRILESIIRDTVTNFLDEHNLIRNTQHGFSKGKSCQTNLLTFFDKVTGEVDRSREVDVVYLDFAKAFDKVPHFRLSLKLKSLGIEGNILNWIKDWLSNRQQRVVVNGTASPWAPVTSGVPQGCVRTPSFPNIYK